MRQIAITTATDVILAVRPRTAVADFVSLDRG